MSRREKMVPKSLHESHHAGLPYDARWFADWLFDQESSGILN
jgi:hypothetical protein